VTGNIPCSNQPANFEEFFAPFGNQSRGFRPKKIAFHELMPAYPDTDPEGYAHIISLPENCKEEEVDDCIKTMQYSVGKGYGSKDPVANEFFNGALMRNSSRLCQGVNACEFLDKKHLEPHVLVDADHIPWANDAFQQHNSNGYSALYHAQLFYMFWKDKHCPFVDNTTGNRCSGRACIRSHMAGHRFGASARPYLGCSQSRSGQKHIYQDISQYDIAHLINLFGRERTLIENLEDYGGDQVFECVLDEAAAGAKSSCHDIYSNREQG
jgi:hypothetical protein